MVFFLIIIIDKGIPHITGNTGPKTWFSTEKWLQSSMKDKAFD